MLEFLTVSYCTGGISFYADVSANTMRMSRESYRKRPALGAGPVILDILLIVLEKKSQTKMKFAMFERFPRKLFVMTSFSKNRSFILFFKKYR